VCKVKGASLSVELPGLCAAAGALSVSVDNVNDILQATDAARTQQLDFIESALQEASSLPGWTVLMGHHPAFSGDESYFIEDDTGLPESSAWARVSTTDSCIRSGQGVKLD